MPLIYDAVYNCPAAKQSDPAMLGLFKKRIVQQVTLQAIKTSEFLRLYHFPGEAGIHPVVVKGIICRELYPNPDYRPSSDEDLLSSGIYGDAYMSRRHSSNITLSAMEAEKRGISSGNSVLKTLFPPARYMKAQYAYVKKFPFLLPAAWLNRILKYRKESADGKSNNAAESIRIGNERVELMREYGIIGKGKE